MGELVSRMSCCPCGQVHVGCTLTPGWFADGMSKLGFRATKLICPGCLEKMGVKSTKGYAVEPVQKEVQHVQ
jgi:hypothetical protein